VLKEFGGEVKRCRRHIHQLFEGRSDEFWCMSFTKSQILWTNHRSALFAQLFGAKKWMKEKSMHWNSHFKLNI